VVFLVLFFYWTLELVRQCGCIVLHFITSISLLMCRWGVDTHFRPGWNCITETTRSYFDPTWSLGSILLIHLDELCNNFYSIDSFHVYLNQFIEDYNKSDIHQYTTDKNPWKSKCNDKTRYKKVGLVLNTRCHAKQCKKKLFIKWRKKLI
jgi:hypothetical protein